MTGKGSRLRARPRESAARRIVRCLRLHDRIASTVVAAAMAGCLALGPPAAHAAASAAPPCAPSRLNVSAARAGGAVTVSPTPDSVDASYRTQISFVGVPAAALVGVSAVGARSGAHPGRLLPYSQGDGASFVPDTPFAQGEVVTVHAVLWAGAAAKRFSWHFTVADVDAVSRSLETPPPPPPRPRPGEIQQFVSRPDLEPPTVTVTTDSGAQTPGDLFLAPYAGPGQYGPMILDGNGKLLWFKPPSGRSARGGPARPGIRRPAGPDLVAGPADRRWASRQRRGDHQQLLPGNRRRPRRQRIRAGPARV